MTKTVLLPALLASALLASALLVACNGETTVASGAAPAAPLSTTPAASNDPAAPVVTGPTGKAAGEKYLADNAGRPGVKVTASGLQYQVLREGTGAHPAATDTVTVNYRGILINGQEFDSSYKRGQPISFPLNGVIPGWTEGVQLMTVGSKYRFFIPSKLAYGEMGAGGAIGPDEALVFDVELLGINQ